MRQKGERRKSGWGKGEGTYLCKKVEDDISYIHS
jgi:hypothetical protein